MIGVRLSRRAAARGTQQFHQARERQRGDLGDIQPGESDRQRLGPKALSVTDRTRRSHQKLQHAFPGERALCVSQCMEQIAANARERPLVARLFFSLESSTGFFRSESGIYRHRRLLLGEKNPVPILPRKLAPRTIDIVTKRDQYVALVLAAPCGRPRCNRPLPDGQRVVGNHRLFGRIVDAANPVTARAGTFGAVR